MIKSLLRIVVVLSCTILMHTGFAYGEYYYKYTDKNGTLHFTDNLEEVPISQRVNENRFYEIKQAPPVLNESEIEKTDVTTGNQQGDTILEIQALNEEKRRLETIYDSLFSKVESLKKERTAAKTQEAFSAYQKNVTTLNKEITAFEKQREAFELKLKRYKERAQNKGEN